MTKFLKDVGNDLVSKLCDLDTWNVIISVLIVGIVIVGLTGCQGFLVGNIKSHDEAPGIFNKEGLSRPQMLADSQSCQDKALAAHSTYDTYASTMGYTPEQVSYYNQCMLAKGYQRVN